MVTPLQEKLVNAFLASHHGVISLRDARSLGLTDEQVKWNLRTGRWTAIHRGIYRRAGDAPAPEGRLLAACLAAGRGAVASHTSAAWLWQLIEDAPASPTVTVTGRRSERLAGAQQHRHRDLDESRVLVRRSIPVTDPIRTLADLGEVAGPVVVDDAVDRALARRLVTVEGLEREVRRLARPGRRGVAQLRSSLARRGFGAPPHPSVLESRTLRLLRGWGIVPVGTEAEVCDGRYRVDFLLRPGVALEVDGFAFHWSPEAKAADSRRRNDLRLAGVVVIEADWVTVTRYPERLRPAVVAALTLGVGA